MEENPDIKLTPEDLTFIKELICGGDEEKIKKKEYPYKARGTEHFFLYEIISNKTTGIHFSSDAFIIHLSVHGSHIVYRPLP